MIFTPSFPYRLTHTVVAFLVTTGFVILGVAAMYLRQQRSVEESRVMLKMSLGFLTIMVPLQVLLGDLHGLNTLHHQPAKLAAMEGLWETRTHVPASLFAIPDMDAEANRWEIAIPDLGSLYLTHSLDKQVQGLKDFPREDRPPVAIVYFAFRLMVGVGLLMLAVVVLGWLALRRGHVTDGRSGWLRLAQACMPIGFVAVLAGWTTTEVGRQPWVVYGLMRTRDAVTPSLTTGDVTLSLVAYVVAYLVIFGGGFVLLRRMVVRGPEAALAREHYEEVEARAARPLSAATDAQASAQGATHGA